MKTVILLFLVLLATSTSGQIESIPPLNLEIFKSPGKTLVSYDELTGKTSLQSLILLSEKLKSDVHLIVIANYEGRKPKKPLTALLVLFTITQASVSHKDDKVLFLIDDERVEVSPLYFSMPLSAPNEIIEGFVLPSPFGSKEVRLIGNASRIKGRIGTQLNFEINAAARQSLTGYAAVMDGQ